MKPSSQLNLQWSSSSGSANVNAFKILDTNFELSAEQIRSWGSCPVITLDHLMNGLSVAVNGV